MWDRLNLPMLLFKEGLWLNLPMLLFKEGLYSSRFNQQYEKLTPIIATRRWNRSVALVQALGKTSIKDFQV